VVGASQEELAGVANKGVLEQWLEQVVGAAQEDLKVALLVGISTVVGAAPEDLKVEKDLKATLDKRVINKRVQEELTPWLEKAVFDMELEVKTIRPKGIDFRETENFLKVKFASSKSRNILLWRYSTEGNLLMVIRLVAAKADPSARNENGKTAEQLATQNNNKDVASFLEKLAAAGNG